MGVRFESHDCHEFDVTLSQKVRHEVFVSFVHGVRFVIKYQSRVRRDHARLPHRRDGLPNRPESLDCPEVTRHTTAEARPDTH